MTNRSRFNGHVIPPANLLNIKKMWINQQKIARSTRNTLGL